MPDKPRLPVRVLPLNPHISDGEASAVPSGSDYVRNDQYWLEKIGEKWANDLGLPDTHNYQIQQLPTGFSAWERTRPSLNAKGKGHTDRYVYGQGKRVFRSVTEFYPHFKHLMEGRHPGTPCTCSSCSGQKQPSGSSSITKSHVVTHRKRQTTSPRQSGVSRVKKHALVTKRSSSPKKREKRDNSAKRTSSSGSSTPQPEYRASQTDEEGTRDIYRDLCDQLHAAAPNEFTTPITESTSPDWVATKQGIEEQIVKWNKFPNFVPRRGELVLFVRDLPEERWIQWDPNKKAFCVSYKLPNVGGPITINAPWEAGHITQEPVQELGLEDLTAIPENKRSVNESGFRVQPLAAIEDQDKTIENHATYVHLRAIRPFWMWKDCVGSDRLMWHSTIFNALSVTASVSVSGRSFFRGIWPNAHIFNSLIHIGAEVIKKDDLVRLIPRNFNTAQAAVTDLMRVAVIRLEFLDLDEASNDDQDEGEPWKTALHICGTRFTRDSSVVPRGTKKIEAGDGLIEPEILDYGPWYRCQPEGPDGQSCVPFQFVLGRCYEFAAFKALYSLLPPQPSSFTSVNVPTMANFTANLTRGLKDVIDARSYSKQHDPRIDSEAGKNWYFADTRQEALDYHQVNGFPDGINDISRKEDLAEARDALQVIQGDKTAIDMYQVKEQQRGADLVKQVASSRGLVAGADATHAIATLSTPSEEDEEMDAMEIDDETPQDGDDHESSDADEPTQEIPTAGAFNLDGDSDEDLDAEKGAANLMKSMRQ